MVAMMMMMEVVIIVIMMVLVVVASLSVGRSVDLSFDVYWIVF